MDTAVGALNGLLRFGLGPRRGDFAAGGVLRNLAAPAAARAALSDETRAPAPTPERTPFAGTREAGEAYFAETAPGGGGPAPSGTPAATPAAPPLPQRVHRAEIEARLRLALDARIGLAERMVWFWSNHFCVSASKSAFLRVLAGPFEREAIRPHVFGRFADMLRAVETHPAMLSYLDNVESIGPASQAGQRRGRGLNENLAREILELHTLGASGGYRQTDVGALARLITGWTVSGRGGALGPPGTFVFNPRMHEPGPATLLGRRYEAAGLARGRAALDDLARHPATARFVATKLARHFLADAPPAAAVDWLTEVFRATDGDLGALARALIEAPWSWGPPAKLRSPQEYLVACARAVGHAPGYGLLAASLAGLGQPIWQPPGPNGYPDLAEVWGAPQGVRARLDAAARWGRAAAAHVGDARALARDTLGPRLSRATETAIERAADPAQAVALLFAAPEMQRR